MSLRSLQSCSPCFGSAAAKRSATLKTMDEAALLPFREYHARRESELRQERESLRLGVLENAEESPSSGRLRGFRRFGRSISLALFFSPGVFDLTLTSTWRSICDDIEVETPFWRMLEEELKRDVDLRPRIGSDRRRPSRRTGELCYETRSTWSLTGGVRRRSQKQSTSSMRRWALRDLTRVESSGGADRHLLSPRTTSLQPVENIFRNIANAFENQVSQESWHREVLQRMRLDLTPIRPAVIDAEAYSKSWTNSAGSGMSFARCMGLRSGFALRLAGGPASGAWSSGPCTGLRSSNFLEFLRGIE